MDEHTSASERRNGWYLDNKISLSIVLSLAIYGGIFIWTISDLTARVKHVELTLQQVQIEGTQTRESMLSMEGNVARTREDIAEIKEELRAARNQ